MIVSAKKIFQSFLNDYVKVHFEIQHTKIGLQTQNSLYHAYGKYTFSKHSMCITHWFNTDAGKEFEEFKIEKNNGDILVTSVKEGNKKILMKFSCKTEPLTIKN
jgi:hypothetical protein